MLYTFLISNRTFHSAVQAELLRCCGRLYNTDSTEFPEMETFLMFPSVDKLSRAKNQMRAVEQYLLPVSHVNCVYNYKYVRRNYLINK